MPHFFILKLSAKRTQRGRTCRLCRFNCAHMLRLMIGGGYRFLLPASALGGGLLVIIADTVARSAFDPIELPAGILLSFLGGPFFLYLIYRREEFGCFSLTM